MGGGRGGGGDRSCKRAWTGKAATCSSECVNSESTPRPHCCTHRNCLSLRVLAQDPQRDVDGVPPCHGEVAACSKVARRSIDRADARLRFCSNSNTARCAARPRLVDSTAQLCARVAAQMLRLC